MLFQRLHPKQFLSYTLDVGFKFILDFEERLVVYGRTDGAGCELKIVNAIGYDEAANTIKKDHIVYKTFVADDFLIDRLLPVGKYIVFLINETDVVISCNVVVHTVKNGKEIKVKRDEFGNFNLYERR